MGIGFGTAITSTAEGGQGVYSQRQLDIAVPDPEFCRQWGASALVSQLKSLLQLTSLHHLLVNLHYWLDV